MTRFSIRLLLFVALPMLILAGFIFKPGKKSIDFNAQVRPILNKNCLACHGGVKQSGGFSLLFEEDALSDTDAGKPAIIPGKPDKSEFIRRLMHHDPEERMPLEKEPLSKDEINILRQWVKEGAKWERHWAYIAPEKPKVPKGGKLSREARKQVKNEIDNFVFAKLKAVGLVPSPQADCITLIRRLSLDLTGLPPTEEMRQKFCDNPSDEVYAQIVDELLASPHFGEKWASMWMDLARYADTKGYERDPHREIWMYRDWLIKAFNENMPFDQFTIDQLAGDLVENPAPQQYVATAFHRNTMNNDEGGTDNEEYRIAAILDRVNTTWEVWQGTSFGCVQCHSHPYDPFRQKEYYQFYDFFNQSADADIFAETPTYKFFKEEDSAKLTRVMDWIKENMPGEEDRHALKLEDYENFIHITEPKIHPHTCDSLTNAALADTKFLRLYEKGFARMPELDLRGKRELLVNTSGKLGGRLEFRLDALDGPLLGELRFQKGKRGYQVVALNTNLIEDKHRVFVQFLHPDPQSSVSISWFNFFEGLPGEMQKGYASIEEDFFYLLNARSPAVPVMYEHSGDYRRITQVFHRGNIQDKGEQVSADVPMIMPPLPREVNRNRLSLAKWLVSPENPLTSRVIVNRFWEQLFGRGIVESLEDFGTMGVPPSHPHLLDWLAVHFREDQKWDLKALLKLMVSSATYRQASTVTSTLQKKDPHNRLWARGPRVRLTAEQIRDQALAVSGLLSKKMYGKSVMPPQPEGIWQVVYNSASWKTSKGDDRYRRALYTYWRRTSPYPSFVSFDSPSREVCTSRRINTNTPLQALVTLNDPVYVEAAIHLAQNAISAHGAINDAIAWMYEQSIFITPSESVLQNLQEVFTEANTYYETHQPEIEDFLSTVEFELECQAKSCQKLVAMSLVANTIMNLDVFITKE